MSILWIVAIVLTVFLLLLLVMLGLRKINFDAIHHNFLELVDEVNGKVIRRGFAVRPRLVGTYKGQEFSVSITTDKSEGKRLYYIGVSMRGKSQFAFSILDNASIRDLEIVPERRERMRPVFDDRYSVEVDRKDQLNWLKIDKIEQAINGVHPFGYVLVGRSNMILERAVDNIFDNTKAEVLRPLLEGLSNLHKAVS